MTDTESDLSLFGVCRLHYSRCQSTNCFWKQGILPTYQCILDADLHADCVPDSLQAGHSLRLELPHRFACYQTSNHGLPIVCSSNVKSSSFKVTCSCSSTGMHLALADALCDLVNHSMADEER
ncbi:E3 12.5K [Bovine mastadenovirus A]|uniref:E3 12.5K n=1 Tax=Bovine adenovirus 1 TaxID=10546 RepID=O71199_9ADEN|nr:E3 12.5K [Bovine mastadenovirus A]AAC40821.1 unknown [Bovine adenovirus 1]